MNEKQAFRFARNVARRTWNDDEAESAAGLAVIDFLKLTPEGNPYALLKTITIRRVHDAMRKKNGRVRKHIDWPTVATDAGGRISDAELEYARSKTQPFGGVRHPVSLNALVGEEVYGIDKVIDESAEDEIEHAISRLSANAEVAGVMEKLDSREQKVFYLLSEGLNLREVGEEIGLTESRICQLRSRARKRIGV